MASTALKALITNYHELNPATIDELPNEPSPLEFMRYVARNRPFVVRGGAASWPATQQWNMAFLRETMGEDSMVNVAITPAGNADSVTANPVDGKRYFVKPLEEEESFGGFLEYVQRQERRGEGEERGEVKYAQTQNNNLPTEYGPLAASVPPSIPWARIALSQPPDAVNLWIGNSGSVTALHRDNYENVYCQLVGRKHFVLLPPIEMPCVGEATWTAATYVRGQDGALRVRVDEPGEEIPFAVWDPDTPEANATTFSRFSRPLRVSLDPGDMLYLPALWYHKVGQSSGPEGICCAVNYWYDMDFTGSAYATSVFIRDIFQTLRQDASFSSEEP